MRTAPLSCGAKIPCVLSVAGSQQLPGLLAGSCVRLCHPPSISWQPKPWSSGSVFALCLLVVGFLFLLNANGWTCAKIRRDPPRPSRSYREGKTTPPPKNMAHVWVCRMHMRWIYCSTGLRATPSGSVICSVTRVFLWQKVCYSSAGEKHNQQQQQQKITKSKQVFLLNLHALKPFLWTFTTQHSVHWWWMSSSGFKRWEQCRALKSLNWKFLAFHLFSHSREKTSHKTFLCA